MGSLCVCLSDQQAPACLLKHEVRLEMLYYFDMGAFFCKVKDIYSKKKKHLALLFEKETSNNSIQTVIQFLNKSTTLTVHLKCMYQRIVPYL